ncbi:hypothetical protein ABIB57_002353 [Devosia sp. UYZn731]|uniref:hypothetical protein n=1 Tax=Devosia sp. UYZn731 TaxID=3156345 RepID=UPI003395C0D5
MTKIKIPKAFHDFVAFYALDAIEFNEMPADDMGELVDNALQYITNPADRIALQHFLTLILDSDATDDRLSGLWSGSGPVLVYSDGTVYRSLLATTRERLVATSR